MGEARKIILSEKTLIPVSMLSVIVGGVFWLSSMHALSKANAADIKENKSDVLRRLDRIENKVDRLIEASKAK